jgi:hypothetical protein
MQNKRFTNDYIESVKCLTNCVNSPLIGFYNPSSKGFKSNAVPRVEPLINLTPSNRFKRIENKILQSIDSINMQNEKFKDILKDSKNLPNIKEISSQREILNKFLPSTGKFMGEKYNPHNFIYNFQKSAIRRNKYGALFQH